MSRCAESVQIISMHGQSSTLNILNVYLVININKTVHSDQHPTRLHTVDRRDINLLKVEY